MFGYLRPIAILSYLIGLPILLFKAFQPIGTKPDIFARLSVGLVFLGLAASLAAGWKFRHQLRYPRLFLAGNITLAVGTIGSFFPIGGGSLLPLWLLLFFAAIIGGILASVTAFLWQY